MHWKGNLFLASCLLLLFLTARKCRQLSGEDSPHERREEKLRSLNCFDLRLGTVTCITKPAIKFYYFYTYFSHKQKSDSKSTSHAVVAKTNMGPAVSSALDYLQMLYFGISGREALISTFGSFVGAYVGGSYGGNLVGDDKTKSTYQSIGFVSGSIAGSWFGQRVGFMVYDVGHGFRPLVHHYFHKGNDTVDGASAAHLEL